MVDRQSIRLGLCASARPGPLHHFPNRWPKEHQQGQYQQRQINMRVDPDLVR